MCSTIGENIIATTKIRNNYVAIQSFIKNEGLLYLTKKLRDSVIPTFRHSVILWLRDFSFFLSNIFVFEPILLKLSMNANIVKMQSFYKIKYDLRGHSRSQKMTFLIKFRLFFCLCYWLIEETNAAEHYERTKFDLFWP